MTFRTDADLNGADINALYAMADPCDDTGSGRMTGFGPFTDSDAPKELPLRGNRASVARYLVYVPVTGEIWGDLGKDGRTPVAGTFDLRQNEHDLCFFLEHTGYPWATRTNSIRVTASTIKRAVEPTGS